MRSIYLSSLVAAGTISTLALATLPAQAQFVSIPVTNGNFVITKNMAGVTTYTTLPTFLSPAGTLTITGGNAATSAGYQSPTPVTTNTPTAFIDIGSYAGSATLNDGRTATFTGAGASLRGTATITGAASIPATGTVYPMIASSLPNGASFTYTVQSGAIHVRAASLSAYPTTQFTIPVSGGSFTLTDPTGTGNATVTINSLLTPLGTTNLTFSSPNLSNAAAGLPIAFYPTSTLTANLGGLANGTVALSDGRTATVTDRLTHLTANTQVVTLPPGQYIQGAKLLTTPVTIQGTITSGSISVPESAVAFPPAPVQPPVVLPPVVLPPVVEPPQPPVVQPPKQEFVLGFAQDVNLGGEPTEYLKLVELERVPVSPAALPDVEASPLAYSRIHPGVNAYNR